MAATNPPTETVSEVPTTTTPANDFAPDIYVDELPDWDVYLATSNAIHDAVTAQIPEEH
ncbi:hypothetical protein [Haloferax sp. ATB1]|uniref:hypothetical protein n=1 Tax=Haloferax sp. ATB1 TaxID=1508454 RepID=UPI000A840159|nr:hypothetical protein [Haloferax sp. ATB1]